jgi:peptide/histidine transporter 3/4
MAAIDECRIQSLDESCEERNLSHSLKQVAGEISAGHLEQSCCSHLRSSGRQPFCLRTKSTSLILFWSFLTGVFYSICTNPYFVITRFTERNIELDLFVVGGVFILYAFLQLFYPLAGLLADVHYGRYKCVIGSLWSFTGGSIVLSVVVFILGCSPDYLKLDDHTWSYAVLAVELAVLGIPAVAGALFCIASIIAFNANIIQFGLDQLHDSPTEHLVLYIRWYVLVSFIGYQVATLITSFCFLEVYHDLSIVVLIMLAYVLLISSLCVGYYKRRAWFLTDSGSRNPYRLVYRVISFARKYTYPVRRSAFTYCEDELPSRLDLGKEKYGGPFTTEQVENVKVFLGLLRVLLSLGPLFAVERSSIALLPIFTIHLSGKFSPCIHSHFSLVPFITNGILPSFLTICLMILYIVFLRHLLCNCFRGMLKRMSLGMAILIAPNICFLVLDTVGHTHRSHASLGCFLVPLLTDHPLRISPLYLFIPRFCCASGYVIFYIAVYDFLCAQSPHSMKGLLIGTLYAIRGVFQLLGALVVMFPFLGWRLSSSFPSCGFAYYFINIALAIVGFVAFMYAAKNYKYRQRDEPDHIFRYAEEYYGKYS